MKITASGNVEVPSYRVIISKGYRVERIEGTTADEDIWIATNEQNQFSANGPTELLGIISMFESRGENWLADDEEIEDFLTRYKMK